MATPLSADRMVEVLKAEGVLVTEVSGWRTNNRNHKGAFGPVNGITIHHTAGVGTGMVSLCFNGTGTLPGPLCHAVGKKDGGVHLVGHGRANHAGTFAQNAFDAVLAESSTHPRPNEAEPVDGNRHFYGIEIENKGDGSDPYPAVQYGQAVRWAAALCRAHGWSAESVIGHKEGTRRKIDPSFPMDGFRKAVAERLTHAASWSPGDAVEEDEMQLSDQITLGDWIPRQWPNDAGLQDKKIPVDVAIGSGYAHSRKAAENTVRILGQLEAQKATIDRLVETVAALAANVGDLDPEQVIAELKEAIASISVRLEVGE